MICKYCGNVCTLTPSQLKHGHTLEAKTQCNSCGVTKRRWKSKLELIAALGGKCNRCGWNVHPAGLQFHHTDPTEKSFGINGNKLLVKERHEEVKKCELLCACCHAIEHANVKLIEKMGLLPLLKVEG